MLVGLALAGTGVPATAAPGVAEADAARQALFAQMLADPGNVQLALRYAQLAAAAGDLEGAISTLERLLIFAPTLARLNYELGVLYYRLGAYALASTYFTTARDAPDATPQIVADAGGYLAAAARASSGQQLSGVAMAGARYQSNANGGADNPLVDLNGIPFILSGAALADPDSNAFVAGSLNYAGDLASQGDKFVASASAYGTLQARHDELNTLAAEARFGPVFDLERFAIAHSSLGFYGLFGAAALKGDPYLYAVGAGAVATTRLGAASEARARLDYRYETYLNSVLRPNVEPMSGGRTRLGGELQHQLSDAVGLYGTLYGERKDALVALNADWEAGASLGAVFRFAGPVATRNGPWTLDVSTGVKARQYDAADPVISTVARHDTEIFVQSALTVPLGENWAAVGTLGYSKQISNYGLYAFDNASTSLALLKGF